MTSYAKVRWDIITEWNSDAKYTNDKLISMASELGVEIRNKNADRKSIVAKVVDAVIKSDVDKGDCTITEWGVFSKEQIQFENYMGILGVPEPSLDLDLVFIYDVPSDAAESDGEKPHIGSALDDLLEEEEHIYEDEEEEELPDFKKMTKKALDEWAEERNIILDRRKTKAHMIAELNKQL
jgi:hypothetical protein